MKIFAWCFRGFTTVNRFAIVAIYWMHIQRSEVWNGEAE